MHRCTLYTFMHLFFMETLFLRNKNLCDIITRNKISHKTFLIAIKKLLDIT